MKVGYQFFMKQSPASTNYSLPLKKPPISSTNAGAQSETQETTDKLTDGNNLSTIYEDMNNKNQDKTQQQTQPALSSQRSLSYKKQSSLSLNNPNQQKQLCKIHMDKSIEYFCSQCNISVCSKCMFLHHNGHDLAQIDDALKLMLTKLTQFDAKILECIKENEETKQILMSSKTEIEGIQTRQQTIIDNKFKELINKLEERKNQLSRDIMHKFESATFKVNDKIKLCKEQLDDMEKARAFYQGVMEKLKDEKFIKEEGTSEQIEFLNKVAEYDKFIYEQTVKLKTQQTQMKSTKIEYQEGASIGLKTIDVGIQNALSLIQTLTFDGMQEFKMPPQQNKQRFSTISSEGLPIVKLVQKDSNNQLMNFTPQPRVDASFTFPKQQTITTASLPLIPRIASPTQNILVQKPNSSPKKSLLTTSGSNISQILNQNMNSSQISQSRSKSVQDPAQTEQNNDDPQKTIVPPSAYNSKFARLRFQRQGTDASQELCLGVSPSERKAEQTKEQPEQLPQQQIQKEEQKHRIDDEQLTHEEQVSQKIKIQDNAIYCIGDTRFFLMFDYKNSTWNQIFFDKKESDYQGTLKFSSICQINMKKREFMMTGGCNTTSKEASSQCFRFALPSIRVFREVQRMKQPRYGHASVFINQLVLVMGGFNHRDDEAMAPSTLNTCEKYSIKENEWTPIAPMQQERAYFSVCRVKEEFIYAFGGFQNYETTNSIEFYNIMLDKWTLLSITMPIKLAKYGLARIEENQIVIAGGLLVDNSSTRSSVEATSYSCVNTVYKFDCNTLKWTKLAKLNFRRNMYSNMPVKENLQIFAIGGTLEGINEVYDIRKKKWNTCQSYTSIMGQNDLQTYAICSLSKFSDE